MKCLTNLDPRRSFCCCGSIALWCELFPHFPAFLYSMCSIVSHTHTLSRTVCHHRKVCLGCCQWIQKLRLDGFSKGLPIPLFKLPRVLTLLNLAIVLLLGIHLPFLIFAQVLVMMPFGILLWLGSTAAFCVTIA